MENLESIIPEEFYKEDQPRVETVGELIKELERLPSDLLLSGWPERSTHEVAVYNVTMNNPHVSINEVDI